GATITITASVPKDTMNEGVTWLIVAGPGAPTPYGTFLSTNAEAMFTAPVTVTGSYYVTITATSIAFPTETNSVKITVQPPQPLKITTTSLPNGTLKVVYSGATLQAKGGVVPYTWSLAAGSGPLPTGLSLSNSGAISGTPNGATGVSTFTVQVSDGETPAMTQTASLSITITNLLSGNYAFEFSGFNSHGAVVAAGTFTSDGVSKISGGVEDFNTIAGPPTNGTLETFTGTYTIGTGGRGTLTFTTSASGALIYSFALDSTGLHGRLVESDSSGNRGSGEIAQQQNVTSCAFNTLSGPGPLGADFVIGVTGAEASFGGTAAGPFALAGRFTAEVPVNSSTPGTIDTGEEDVNAPASAQPIVPDTTLSGTFQTTSQASRCTMGLSEQIGNMTFSVYPVTVSSGLVTEAYIVETDTVSAITPFVSAGKLIHQTGYPFIESIQSFTAPGVVGLAGAVIPSGGAVYVPYAAVAAVQPNGGTGFNLALVQNVNGTVSSALGTSAIPVNFDTGDSFGRVNTTLLTPVDPVFYVINFNEALCLLENVNAPVLGILEPQSAGPYSSSTIAGTLTQGTSAPATTAVQNFSGVTTLTNTNTTSGTVAGIEDLSTTGGNSLGLAVSGTYALTSSGQTDGSGTLSLTQAPPPPVFNGAFFIVSPTKAVTITTTAGDTNPVLVILGDQTDDFGVN
ncbi:MAG TPA: Ig domain-containing protein, partial [Candidatus Acidoferrales bacterium]|nr:Ig domain-containing protein [Candidatus Acidoferrales bacterium]